MMNHLKAWYHGWKATARLHLFDREALRVLKKPSSAEMFVEVSRPGDDQEHQRWLDSLKPGDLVCDCRFRHLKIAIRDGDYVLLSDGSPCSLSHCCDPADHPEPHPE